VGSEAPNTDRILSLRVTAGARIVSVGKLKVVRMTASIAYARTVPGGEKRIGGELFHRFAPPRE
jgi:hypothetical protein